MVSVLIVFVNVNTIGDTSKPKRRNIDNVFKFSCTKKQKDMKLIF
jgi:hypothetical protein